MIALTVALVKDTFREALARRIFWGLYGLSTLLILFFLFVLKIDVVEGAIATLSLFGLSRTGSVQHVVARIYAAIATFLFIWGTLLSLFASSGLVPSVLEPGRIELILSKPIRRTHLLLGRFLGNLTVVALNSAYLVTGVWIILGLKTGIWSTSFLWAIVMTIFVFAVFLTIVIWIGVRFESAALATMISVGMAMLSIVLAQRTVAEKLLSSEWSRDLWNGFYYLLPKFWDLGSMTRRLVLDRQFDSLMPVWSSALFAGIVLLWALRIFARRDF